MNDPDSPPFSRLVIPIGIILSITGVQVTLNVFAEFVGGYIYSVISTPFLPNLFSSKSDPLLFFFNIYRAMHSA